MPKKTIDIPTLTWDNGCVKMIDQTLLPEIYRVIAIKTPQKMWDAIKRLVVRGAPAIGCAAAFGALLGIWKSAAKDTSKLLALLNETADYLATSRPTAVNLFWALDRMKRVAAAQVKLAPEAFKLRMLKEAEAIFAEDKKMCRAIGRHALPLIPKQKEPFGILTHCNAGGLATSGYGTALAVMYAAAEAGRNIQVYSDETRPLLQGARLTVWELMQAKIPVTLICDNMASQVMKEGRIGMIVVGADRIAANGDAANKIGTCGVAILAKHYGVPFYVAAPSSTFDLSTRTGSGIPIEQRDGKEIKCGFGRWTAPRTATVYNPAFDVTPAGLISGIITERGIIQKPNAKRVQEHLA